jgi:predicted phage terminase large subunit-like protein
MVPKLNLKKFCKNFMEINLKKIEKLPTDVQREFLETFEKYTEKKKETKIHSDFMAFVKHMWPDFIEGKHHKIVAEKFNQIAEGKLKRLIINMPPRHTKSEFASYLLPAWMVGRNPKLKIIQSTNTTELSVRFGAITGRGADLLIIDDPHSEQDAMNRDAMERAYEWYTSGPRQRLQPGGAIVLVMTRWNTKDLTGKLLGAQREPKADQWDIVEFPAILPSGKSLWPEYWKKEELLSVKASVSLTKWNAQYMQNPTSEEGAIIKREWWKRWEEDWIPALKHVIQSYDTAFSKKESADFSAITTWGVFYENDDSPANLILLDCQKGRWDFPELKQVAQEQFKYWDPDTVIIESKASGQPLTDELRKMGIPVVNFSPSKGNDKHTRVNSVAPLFESGMIWAPMQDFAEEVIEECAAFPFGDNDDLVDSTTQAIMRFRQGGFVLHPDDYKEDPQPQRKRIYY